MFVRNAWYCAGWDYSVTLARDAVVARQIAGERVVLFRTPDGRVHALEDRCPHRQAALSLGRKEGDTLRCMYHGLRFATDGRCVEVPARVRIPERAQIRVFPVVEKDNWIWVWMGDPTRADEALIPFAVGPDADGWNIRTSEMTVKANYRPRDHQSRGSQPPHNGCMKTRSEGVSNTPQSIPNSKRSSAV